MKRSLFVWAGLLISLLGYLNGRFFILRPNRIMSGTLMNIRAALGEDFLVLAALFAIVLVLLIYLKHVTSNKAKNSPQVILLGILNLVALLNFAALLFFSGKSSIYMLLEGSKTVRISVGAGFWLSMAGSILIIYGVSELLSSRFKWVGLFNGISTCTIAYLIFYQGWLNRFSIIIEIMNKQEAFKVEVVRHVQLSLFSSLAGLVLSLIMVFIVYKDQKKEKYIFTFVNMSQVIPTLSLIGIIMVPLTLLSNRFVFLREMGISGIGFVPSFIVLTLYSMLPITSSALAAMKNIDRIQIECAKGLGMNTKEIFQRIELPQSLPGIFSGYRVALIQCIGNTVLAGLVGGGGIGAIMFLGLAQSAPDLVVASALIVVLLGASTNVVLEYFEGLIKARIGGV